MSNFQVGDLVIHRKGDEIAIVLRVGDEHLDVYTIYDTGSFKVPNTYENRLKKVWNLLTEETTLPLLGEPNVLQ